MVLLAVALLLAAIIQMAHDLMTSERILPGALLGSAGLLILLARVA